MTELRASGPGRQRLGVITELPAVLREMGVDPTAVCERVGIDPAVLRNPENALNLAELQALTEAAEAAAACPWLGLAVGARGGTRSLGLVGRLMASAPTLGQAITDLCVYQELFIRGSVTYLRVVGDTAMWGHAVFESLGFDLPVLSDGSLAIAVAILRELAGVEPEEVRIPRRAPADVAPYRRFLGADARFNADECAVVFPSRLLARRPKDADPAARAMLNRAVAEAMSADRDLTHRVRRALGSGVAGVSNSLEGIADQLGMHPRTLNRRLQAEGVSFRMLLNEERFRFARQLLDGTTLPVVQIALALGYSDQSAFTHAFRQWSGMAPGRWRERQVSTPPAFRDGA